MTTTGVVYIMKFDIIVADPPYSFSDKLNMSQVKRSADANYKTLSIDDIKKLEVEEIAATDSVLVLWVPSSMLQDGLDIIKNWGFEQKQTFVWVKTKKSPLEGLTKKLKKLLHSDQDIKEAVDSFDINEVLSFYMGRLFRQTHEIALIGVRGKVYGNLQNKSQRSVLLDSNIKHSAKPGGLQSRLDLMFPQARRLEIFARRERPGWTCIGLECPATLGADVRDSIKLLKNI